MKSKYFFSTLIIVILIAVTGRPQVNHFSIKAEVDYAIPVGMLSSRFLPTIGQDICLGQQVSKNTSWFGKIEYTKFSEMNDEKLFVKRKRTVYSREYSLQIPIENLKMQLEIVSAGAEIQYFLTDFGFIKTKLNVGFSINRWFFSREVFKDSLFSNLKNGSFSGTSDTTVFMEYINLTSNSQQDWSGALTFGFTGEIPLIDNFEFLLTAEYRLIIGELWPTLKLDLENVSGLQMIQMKSGLKYTF